MATERSEKVADDETATRNEKLLKAYRKFMTLPAESIRRNWEDLDPERMARGMTKAEACDFGVKRSVREWYEQLLSRTGGHDMDGADVPSVEEEIDLFDLSRRTPLRESVLINVRQMSSEKCELLAASRREAEAAATETAKALEGKRGPDDDDDDDDEKEENFTLHSVWEEVLRL